MRRISIIFISIFLACAILNGCGNKAKSNDKTLARVSSKVITLNEFQSRIAKMPPYYRKIVENNKKRYLDDCIVEMLFYEEAVRRGLERDKEVKEVLSEAKKKIVIAKLIKSEVEDKIKISDEEMKEFYDAHKDEFKTPELWRASHILVSDEKQAKSIADELSKGANFEELAKKYSIDATASRGGDVGYFRMGQLVPDFEHACLKLSVGQTSDIVSTQFGYHIIKLTDKKDASVQTFEEAKRAIENELKKVKRSELFNKLVIDLKAKYGVKIEEDVFESLKQDKRS